MDVVTGDYDVFRYDGLFSLKNLFLALNQKMNYKIVLPMSRLNRPSFDPRLQAWSDDFFF